jgi:hypothetical protein
MNDKTRNPSPGMPGHDKDDDGPDKRHMRPGEHDDRNRTGKPGERQTGQGTSPGQSGQNPSTQRDD